MPVVVTGRRSKDEVTRALKTELRDLADEMEVMEAKLALKRQKRNRLIVSLADRGVSEREIGRLGQVTSPRVNQIYHSIVNGR